jgi:diguanylate cyclase (GGDEF)-like protein
MITIDKNLFLKSPELSQLVLNHLGACVSIKDKNKKYIYANDKLQGLFSGVFDSIIGLDDSHLFDLLSYSNITESDDRVLCSGNIIENKEVITIKSTGQKRAFLSSKQPILSLEKEIIGVLCVSTDISELHFNQKKLEVEATTDPLTGLYNRRFFFRFADNFLSQSIRHNNSLSLIMLDIDFFKEINDKYGHPVGDKVIQFVATKTQSLLRKEDVLARVGGEEYLILLPNTGTKEAQLIAEKLRSFIDLQSVTGDWNGVIYPKISLGVSSYTKGDLDFNEVYVRSDKALYQAKMTGRNKTCIYEERKEVENSYK